RLYRALLFWMAQDHSLASEPVFAFSIARNRLDDSVCCQFLQQLRCSGGPEAGHLHHVCPSKYSSVRKSLPHPGNMTGSLGSEYLSNVRFLFINVRFLRFLQHITDVQCPVFQRMMFVKQQISQEKF